MVTLVYAGVVVSRTYVDSFYIALFSALEQTHFALVSDSVALFFLFFLFNIHRALCRIPATFHQLDPEQYGDFWRPQRSVSMNQ